jgi:hypothetical protein
MRPRPLSLLLWIALAGPLSAQIIQPPPEPRGRGQWIGGLDGFAAGAIGEFKKNENGGVGAELFGGYQPVRRLPFVLRASTAMIRYGGFDHDVTEEDCDDDGLCSTEVTYYDSRTHDMFLFQVGPELTATGGKWRPYAQASIGYTVFSSQSAIGPAGREISQGLMSSANRSTVLGIGVRRVKRYLGRESAVDFGVRLIRNPNARWVNEGSLRSRGDGTFDVTPRTGSAHMIAVHVGMWGGSFQRLFGR